MVEETAATPAVPGSLPPCLGISVSQHRHHLLHEMAALAARPPTRPRQSHVTQESRSRLHATRLAPKDGLPCEGATGSQATPAAVTRQVWPLSGQP